MTIAAVFICWTVGCGSAGPSPDEIPDRDVAIVHNTTPDGEEISLEELHRAVAQAATEPKSKRSSRHAIETKALSQLLDAAWLEGQAEEWGISVTKDEVQRKFRKLKDANFKTEKAYHAFLRRSHFTQQEVNERVELQMLSTEVQRRISNVGYDNKKRAFEAFVKDFTDRWRERTVCRPELAIRRCSNGP
jgi:hypothetical protein